MIKNYFKVAWRNLLLHKQMSIINIAGLGIGMAATILIALWVQNEKSFDSFQPDAARVFKITSKLAITKNETWIWETSPYILGDYAVRQIPEIEKITRLNSNYTNTINFRYGDDFIAETKAAYVDDEWFNVFHYDFISGSKEAFLKNPHSLILTSSTAKKYFGKQEPIGKTLRIDSVNYQVQAIVKDNPANSSFQYNVLMPVAAQFADAKERKNQLQWGNYNYITFVKLRPGANRRIVTAKLLNILRANKKDDKGETSFSLQNIRNIHFENDVMSSPFVHSNPTIVNVFIILAVLLLTTACINYVNLTTARSSLRSKEVSVRKIVGANRVHLFAQFMTESFLISLLALFLSLLLVQLTMPWFPSFTATNFTAPLMSATLWTIIGISLFSSFLLNGLYPAVLLSSFKPINVFRGKSLLNFKDGGIRKFLVVTQFTISVILIVGTLVIYTQTRYMQKVDLGYNRSEVFNFNFPWWKLQGFSFKNEDPFLNTVKQELKRQNATANVSLAGYGLVDFDSQSSGSYDWKGRPKDFNPSLAPLQADEGFQQLMHLKLAEGRWFRAGGADKHNVLLNQTAVQMLHVPAPVIGQRFIHQGDTGVVIGIVKDFHFRSLHDKIGPMLISNSSGSSFYIKTTSENAAAALAAAGKVWKHYFPDAPFEYNFLDESYNNLYKAEQQSSLLITLFAVIAVLISALGLLGLAAFAAEQKVKEIGIRKVLGASIRQIVSLLSAGFLKMVIVASVIAFPIAWWAMDRWLQGFAYRISLSWWIFTFAAAIALTISLITVLYQAIRAAVANPVKSLRSE